MPVHQADPYLGCGSLENDVSGGIIVVKRGECSFSQKVLMAQQAGADFVFVVNTASGTLMPMGCHYTDPKCAQINVPSLMIDRDIWNGIMRPVYEGTGLPLDITCPADDGVQSIPSADRVAYDDGVWDNVPPSETPYELPPEYGGVPDGAEIMEQADGYGYYGGYDGGDESTGNNTTAKPWSKCAQRGLRMVEAVCGASIVGGVCHNSKELNFYDALDVCAADGGRLCTQSELDSQVARGTGCELDGALVWTSTPCAAGHRVATGGGKPSNGNAAGASKGECAADGSANYPTRCCYDDQPATASARTCSSIGWSEHPQYPDLCSSSLDGNACKRSGTFSTATAVCETKGARLCTLQELRAGSMRGGGCKAQQVWSSTPCGKDKSGRSFFTSNSGGGTAHTCASVENQTAPIGCCADRVPDGAVSGPLDSAGYAADPDDPAEGVDAVRGPGNTLRTCEELGWPSARDGRLSSNCASSRVNGTDAQHHQLCYRESVTFTAAAELCAAVGARLCTLEEVFGGAANVQGCGMNRQYVWVDAPCASGHRVARALDGAGNACWHPAALKKVRCCADQP